MSVNSEQCTPISDAAKCLIWIYTHALKVVFWVNVDSISFTQSAY